MQSNLSFSIPLSSDSISMQNMWDNRGGSGGGDLGGLNPPPPFVGPPKEGGR